MKKLINRADAWFELSQRSSTISREIRGGIVTFVTMVYVIVLVPQIMGNVTDVNGDYIGGADSPAQAIALVSAATALTAGVFSILMGIFGRFPAGMAVGLGVNAYVTYTLVPTMTWKAAMGVVVIEGLLILILVITGLRRVIYHALPNALKRAIGVGIGLFLTFIALVDAGVVRPGDPLIMFGVQGQLDSWPLAIFVAGLFLMIILSVRKVTGALLIGILTMTAISIVVESLTSIGARSDSNPGGWALSVPNIPSTVVSRPDLSLLGQFNLTGSFVEIGILASILAIFSVMLSDFFDSLGSATAVAEEADLTTSNQDIPHFQSIMIVDSLGAMGGGGASVSSNTVYVESASGVGEGARTGIAAIVTGFLFLAAMVIAPVVTIIPSEAATPALIVVGFLMMKNIVNIPFHDVTVGIPAFLMITLMPFTYSITIGIGAGIISYVVISIAVGRFRQIPLVMWLAALAFVVYFLSTPVQNLL